jgi:hypothetical protein
VSRTTRPNDQNIAVTATQTIGTVVTTAMSNWPTALRFMAVCVALSLPTATSLALYLLIR